MCVPLEGKTRPPAATPPAQRATRHARTADAEGVLQNSSELFLCFQNQITGYIFLNCYSQYVEFLFFCYGVHRESCKNTPAAQLAGQPAVQLTSALATLDAAQFGQVYLSGHDCLLHSAERPGTRSAGERKESFITPNKASWNHTGRRVQTKTHQQAFAPDIVSYNCNPDEKHECDENPVL